MKPQRVVVIDPDLLPPTRPKPCHNCRLRRVNCDKTWPHCLKCKERGYACLGYGIKLSWPREKDGRRSVQGDKHYLIPSRPSQFKRIDLVVTSSEDIEIFLASRQVEPNCTVTVSRPFGSLINPCHHTCHPNPMAQEQLDSLVARLSIHDDGTESLAVRYAASAVSYQKNHQEREAIIYQTRAIQALKTALHNFDQSRAMQLFAASMLLSCFETTMVEASETPRKWIVFFGGAKLIAGHLMEEMGGFIGDRVLVLDWLFYYDAVFKFSVRHWGGAQDNVRALAAKEKIISNPVFSPERQVILPMLGCSQELLDLLCKTVDVVLDKGDPEYRSNSHLKTIRSLEARLQSLKQHYRGPSHLTPQQRNREVETAELYRLALLLYLHRLANGAAKDSPKVSHLLEMALDIMSRIQYVSRSWPLFVVGLEAHIDVQRAVVLSVLEESMARQKLGTMAAVDRMIKTAWVQQDLNVADVDPLETYRRVMGLNHAPLCFT